MLFFLLSGLGMLIAGALLMSVTRIHASIAGLLLFSGLGLLGIGSTVIALPDIYHGWRSLHWQPVSATIVSSHVSSVMPIRANTLLWRAEVRYRYQVGTQWHESDRMDFGGLASIDRAWVEQQLDTVYAPGRSLEIRYNPHQVSQAVIVPGVHARALILTILGLAFAAIAYWQLRDLLRDWHGNHL